MTTTAQVQQAGALLGQNTGGGGGGHLAGVGSIVVDRVIDEVLEPGGLAEGVLPEPFNRWIVQALRTFNNALTWLTGDSSQIASHIGELLKAAAHVGAQMAVVEHTRSAARGCWEGPAAESFEQRMVAESLATRAVAGVLGFCAERHLVLAGRQAEAKRGVIQLVCQLARDLVQAAIRFLAQMGVSLAMGGWDIVSNTVSGAARGAVSGASRGWSEGGFTGAVGGFFSGMFGGGADGARRGAEEAAARIRAAFNNFVAWALGKVRSILAEVQRFCQEHVDTATQIMGQVSNAGVRSSRAAALLRGHTDPGANAARPQHGTYGRDSAGGNPLRRDGDYLTLNQAIGNPDAPLPPGYSRATPEDLRRLGIDPSMLHDSNGFAAEVYRTPDGKYVIAFPGTGAGAAPGTSDGVRKDMFTDDAIEDGIGGATMSPQTGNVLALTRAIQASGHGDDVVYTGHSLGGRLASVAALDTGNAAVTYDSAGVSQATINYIAAKNGMTPDEVVRQANDGQIRRYYAGNDPLTAAQERWNVSADAAPDALGKPYQLGPTEHAQPQDANMDWLKQYDHGHDQTHLDDLWRERYGPNGERLPR